MAAKFTFIGLFFSAIVTFNVVSVDAASESHDFNFVMDDWVNEESKMTGHTWVKGSVGGPVPHNAVRAGLDCDGRTIYVGRAWHYGELLPAKIIPAANAAYLISAGKHHLKHEYEFLCPKNFVWVSRVDGRPPPNAVVCGRNRDGVAVFTGRVNYNGTQTVGAIDPINGKIWINVDGKELSFREWEILISE